MYKLTKREKVLLVVLAAVAVIAGVIMLTRVALTRLDGLREESQAAEQQRSDVQQLLMNAASYEALHQQEEQNINEILPQLFTPMEPELIERTLTEMLLKNGFAPVSLQIISTARGAEAAEGGGSTYYTVQISAMPTERPAEETKAGGAPDEGAESAGQEQAVPTLLESVQGQIAASLQPLLSMIDEINETPGMCLRTYSLNMTEEQERVKLTVDLYYFDAQEYAAGGAIAPEEQ